MTSPDVLVVGGGAAGLMAAVAAARAGASVLLLERNEKLGKKIYITGKGRCNVTNTAAREVFFRNIVRNPRFLYASFAKLDNRALMAQLEQWGTPLKVERGGRVFPVSDKASDITRAFEKELRRLGVQVRLNARVASLICEEGRCRGVRLERGEELRAQATVLATGGLSYPSTGSTGDGHRFAREAGLAVTECRPSLVPVNTVESWPAALSGLTLKNVRLTAVANGKKIFSEQGEMLFTHFGVSGPLVLSLSAYLPDEPRGVQLSIDLKPALEEKSLDDRLVREFREQPRARLSSVLCRLAPRSLAAELIRLGGLPGEACASDITAAQRRSLAALFKTVPLTVDALRGYSEAVITRGGVSVKEINPSTLAARSLPGLYLAGELIDIDACTGGFNLQIAFSTGCLAGQSAADVALAGGDDRGAPPHTPAGDSVPCTPA